MKQGYNIVAAADAPSDENADEPIAGLSSLEMDEIDQMYGRIGADYYDLLGINTGGGRPEVRAAYQDLVRRFHPEAYWNRELGLYRPRVEEIFRAITTAFEVLCDTRRRNEYDETLHALKAPRQPSQSVAAPRVEAEPVVPRTATINAPKMPLRHDSAMPRATVSAEVRVIQAPLPDEDAERRDSSEHVPRDITYQSLRRSHAEHQLKLRYDHAQELLERARQAEIRGARAEQLSLLRQASVLQPNDEGIKQQMAAIDEQMSLSTFERACNAARVYEKDKRWDLAVELWIKASAERPKDLAVHIGVVRASCEGLIELPRAADYARRATQIDPKSAEAFALMARVFFLAGRMASARSAVESALKLDGTHELAIELARKLKVR